METSHLSDHFTDLLLFIIEKGLREEGARAPLHLREVIGDRARRIPMLSRLQGAVHLVTHLGSVFKDILHGGKKDRKKLAIAQGFLLTTNSFPKLGDPSPGSSNHFSANICDNTCVVHLPFYNGIAGVLLSTLPFLERGTCSMVHTKNNSHENQPGKPVLCFRGSHPGHSRTSLAWHP